MRREQLLGGGRAGAQDHPSVVQGEGDRGVLAQQSGQDPQEWLFPNVDLTLHLHRQPTGEWVGLDTQVSWGPTGIGQSSSAVHDLHGPVGTVEQSLTLRPR